MSILVIEGDPGELEQLLSKLHGCHYVGPTIRSELVTAPEMDIDQWEYLLYRLRYKHCTTQEELGE